MHILLANNAHASLFQSDKFLVNITFLKKFENEIFLEKDSSIFTDRAGTSRTSNTSNQVKMGESHYKEELVLKFCKEIVDHLDKMALDKKLTNLNIICEPSFLGELRNEITPALKKLINKELAKNFYTEKPLELGEFLKNHELTY